jgi:hypothetical protein
MNEGREEDKSVQQLNKNKLRWTDQVENVLIGMADKAIVYKVLHEKAQKLRLYNPLCLSFNHSRISDVCP